MKRPFSGACRGFTLTELVVVLAIIGIVLALGVPRYLGARQYALTAEADATLSEIKSLAWAYYQQFGSWSGITNTNVAALLGLQPPPDAIGCWDYGLAADGGVAQIQLLATGDDTPARCGPVSGATVQLDLNGDGLLRSHRHVPLAAFPAGRNTAADRGSQNRLTPGALPYRISMGS